MSWPEALLTPGLAPEGITGPTGTPAARRFDVYRNNVAASLIQALRDGFPTLQRIVGEEFFGAMAGEFVRRHPPRSPVLAGYGNALPAFLEGFPPVAHLPYLADVARLELALRRAYHAADTRPISPDALNHPRLAEARLTLAPAVTLIVSPHPVYSIWRANQCRDVARVAPGAEAVLVSRPDWEPLMDRISPEEARFVDALATARLGDAIPDGLDLAAALSRLLTRNAIVALEIPT